VGDWASSVGVVVDVVQALNTSADIMPRVKMIFIKFVRIDHDLLETVVVGKLDLKMKSPAAKQGRWILNSFTFYASTSFQRGTWPAN
jgi:hypothetical protein